MARKRESWATDAEWLSGCWKMAAELSEAGQLAPRFVITPTNRTGVWRIRTQLVQIVEGRAARIVVAAESEYPSSAAQSLTPHLLQQLHEVDKLLTIEINAERVKPE